MYVEVDRVHRGRVETRRWIKPSGGCAASDTLKRVLSRAGADLDANKGRALVFTSTAHFVNDGSSFFLPLIIDLLAASKGFSPLEVGTALAVYYTLSTLASVYVARLADRSGEMGKLMSVGIVLLGVGLIGFDYAVFDTAGQTLVVVSFSLCALMGFASAFYHPLGATVLGKAFGSSSGGKALGMNGIFGSIGRTLYPSLFFVAAVALTQGGAMVALGAVAIAAGAIVWLGLRRFNATPAKSGGGSAGGLLNRALVAISILTFFRTASMFGVAAWLPEYLTFQKGFGVGTSLGFTLSAVFAVAIVGQPFFGYLLDKFDRRVIFLLSSVGSALSVLALIFIGGALAYAFLISFGFFVYTGFPIFLGLAADYIPSGSEAMGNALVWGLGQTGGNAVGSFVVGLMVLNNYGRLNSAFEAMAVVALVSGIFVMMVPRGGKTEEPPGGETS